MADVYDACFAAFYQQAVQFAQNPAPGDADDASLAAFAIATLQRLSLSLSDEDSTIRRKSENSRNLISIFAKKPKFQRLLHSPSAGKELVQSLHEQFERSQSLAYTGGANDLLRVESLKIMEAFIELGFLNDIEFNFDINGCLMNMTQALLVSNLFLFHDNGMSILSIYSKKHAARVALYLAEKSVTTQCLEFLLNLNPFRDEKCLSILMNRIESTTLEKIDFLDRFLLSLQKAIQKNEINTVENEEQILKILQTCHNTYQRVKTSEDDKGEELSASIQVVLELMVDKNVSSKRVFEFILSLQKRSVSSIALVLSVAESLPVSIWIEVILPYTKEEMNQFSISGVSGSQFEQELILLVRECHRLFFISPRPAPQKRPLAAALFDAIYCAILHGYIETERFPLCLSQIFLANTENDSQAWLTNILAESCTTRTQNAIKEVVYRSTGLLHDGSGSAVSAENAAVAISALTALVTVTVTVILTDISLDFPAFFITNEAQVSNWLLKVRNHLMKLCENQTFDVELIMALEKFFASFAKCVTPSQANLVFDLMLQTHSISSVMRELRDPEVTGGRTADYGGRTDGHLGFDGTMMSDEAVVWVLSAVPLHRPLPLAPVQEALRVCGEQTRGLLAGFAPDLCIADPSTHVRTLAFQALNNRPEVLAEIGGAILSAAGQLLGSAPRSFDLRLAAAAAPPLAKLAIYRSEYIEASLSLLVSCAFLSVSHDPCNVPHQAITSSINQVAQLASRNEIFLFLNACKDQELINRLKELSETWRILHEQYLSANPALLMSLAKPKRFSFTNLRRFGKSQESDSAFSAAVAPSSLPPPISYSTFSYDIESGITVSDTTAIPRFRSAIASSNFIDAIRFAAQARQVCPREYLSEKIAEAVRGEVLPRFRDLRGNSAPAEYDSVLAEISEIATLYPLECEEILQPQKLLAELQQRAVMGFVQKRDFSGARRWMHEKNARNPALLAYIDRSEISSPSSSSFAIEMQAIECNHSDIEQGYAISQGIPVIEDEVSHEDFALLQQSSAAWSNLALAKEKWKRLFRRS